MASTLYLKDNYLNKDIVLISSSKIIEYDLKSAGMNILYSCGCFTDDFYNELVKMDKLKRNVVIGKLLKKKPELTEILMNGFKETRKVFFEMNDISDNDILSIKKDAIFLIDKFIQKTKVNNYLEFIPKNIYCSYLNIKNKEHYLNEEKKLEVKGYSKEVITFQKDYYFKFIEDILKLVFSNNKDELFLKLANFKNDFLNFSLNKEFYKDINLNKYLFSFADKILSSDDIDENIKNLCFTNGNLSFINEIIMKVL